jgi:hypothetical protein
VTLFKYKAKIKELITLHKFLLSPITVIIIVSVEVFPAVAMKNAVFWDVTPRGSCENRLSGETYRPIRVKRISELGTALVAFLRSVLQLLVIANVVLILLILFTRLWRRYIPPKRRFLKEPHGVASKKTAFFTVIFVLLFDFESRLVVNSKYKFYIRLTLILIRNITQWLHILAKFIIAGLQAVFPVPESNDFLVTGIRPKA